LTANGVISLFSSAGRAGEVMHIALMHAALLENLKIEERRREDIARLKKEKRITGRQKTAVDTV